MSNSITWVTPKRPRGVNSHRGQFYVSIGWSKSKNVKNHQITIYVFEDAMRDFRWVVGDKLEIGFDDSFIYMRRSNDGPYRLTSATGQKVDEVIGKPTRARVAFTKPQDFPFEQIQRTHLAKNDVSFDCDGIVSFIYPKGAN